MNRHLGSHHRRLAETLGFHVPPFHRVTINRKPNVGNLSRLSRATTTSWGSTTWMMFLTAYVLLWAVASHTMTTTTWNAGYTRGLEFVLAPVELTDDHLADILAGGSVYDASGDVFISGASDTVHVIDYPEPGQLFLNGTEYSPSAALSAVCQWYRPRDGGGQLFLLLCIGDLVSYQDFVALLEHVTAEAGTCPIRVVLLDRPDP